MDYVDITVPYTDRISLPLELFESLPKGESDDLQQELMDIYYNDNAKILQRIVDYSGGDSETFESKREEQFQNFIDDEYGFEVDILRRRDDKIAKRLVEEIDNYNSQVDLITE
jgi:hypothetical protein